MTKKEVEYQAYLFLRENGMEYAMNASELIETCRDFAYPYTNYFQKEIKELKKENAKLYKAMKLLKERSK